MSPFPRPDYEALRRYDPERAPVRLDLSDNTNLWGTHPGALRRVREATADDLARYPTLYADPLRQAVSDRFGVDPESVTTGAGSDDVLDSAVRASFAPGGRMTYAAPTFSMVEPFALMNGLAATAIPCASFLRCIMSSSQYFVWLSPQICFGKSQPQQFAFAHGSG